MLLTTSQVADRLGVSTRTVREYVNRGELQVIRLSPKHFRFEPAEIARFIEEHSGQVA